MGQRVFAPGVTIVDDPFRARGLRSKPFDGEGLRPVRRAVIEDGILTTWFVDLRSGRQLGIPSTGHASRGTGGPPSPAPTNLWLEPGPRSPEEIIRDVGTGFYVGKPASAAVDILARKTAMLKESTQELMNVRARVSAPGSRRPVVTCVPPHHP
jgi:predicted Zn-dependent protease